MPNWLEIIQYFQESDMTTCQAAELNKRIEFEGVKKSTSNTKKNQAPQTVRTLYSLPRLLNDFGELTVFTTTFIHSYPTLKLPWVVSGSGRPHTIPLQ